LLSFAQSVASLYGTREAPLFDWLSRLFGTDPSEDADEKKRQDDGFTPLVIPPAYPTSEAANACDGADDGGGGGDS
jgi:hypothetical protein